MQHWDMERLLLESSLVTKNVSVLHQMLTCTFSECLQTVRYVLMIWWKPLSCVLPVFLNNNVYESVKCILLCILKNKISLWTVSYHMLQCKRRNPTFHVGTSKSSRHNLIKYKLSTNYVCHICVWNKYLQEIMTSEMANLVFFVFWINSINISFTLHCATKGWLRADFCQLEMTTMMPVCTHELCLRTKVIGACSAY